MRFFNNQRAQVHLGERDDFWSADDRMIWQSEATRNGIVAQVFVYSRARHFCTDQSSTDYQSVATRRTWERVLQFLDEI